MGVCMLLRGAEGGQDTVLSSVLRAGSGLGQPQDCPEVVLRLS